MQSLWKTLWCFLKNKKQKLKIKLLHDPAISLLVIAEENKNTNSKGYMQP